MSDEIRAATAALKVEAENQLKRLRMEFLRAFMEANKDLANRLEEAAATVERHRIEALARPRSQHSRCRH